MPRLAEPAFLVRLPEASPVVAAELLSQPEAVAGEAERVLVRNRRKQRLQPGEPARAGRIGYVHVASWWSFLRFRVGGSFPGIRADLKEFRVKSG